MHLIPKYNVQMNTNFDLVKEGELVCTYAYFGDNVAHYEIRKYGWEENNQSRIYGIEVNDLDGVTIGTNIKIFTEEKEANEFADKYRKEHEKDLEEICNYVRKCTVTRAQIAEKFGIPVNDLVIDKYS